MRAFLLKLTLFISLLLIIITVIFYGIGFGLNRGDFSIPKTKKYIILGHSHPECAFNDSLINSSVNLAQSGESYFYTYPKLKKIIENNSHIETVFISFTNNQIDSSMNEWIWGNNYLSAKLPKYISFMDLSEIFFLFQNNPKATINSISVSIKESFPKLLSVNDIKSMNWGGYRDLKKNKADSLIKNNINVMNDIKERGAVSEFNIIYLKKIVSLCRDNNIQLYFIRTPIHPEYRKFPNENLYKVILKNEFEKVEFLDFKKLPLKNEDFGDLEHLNFSGATKVSKFFNKLLEDGLLKSNSKEQMIDREILLYKVDNTLD